MDKAEKMTVRQKLCAAFKIGLFLIILLSTLWIISGIMLPKWWDGNATKNIKSFYDEPENSLDVLFIGSSDIANGVSPIDIYSQTGITSYIHSSQGQRIWSSYYMIKSDLEYQSPKVIVLNVDGCLTRKDEKEANVAKFLNLLKWNDVKCEALSDDVYGNTVNDIISYAFPVFRYHSRYNELEPKDLVRAFIRYHNYSKGQNTNFKVDPHKSGYKYMSDKGETIAFTDTQREYFDKIVDMCKEKNITLLLTELPSGDSWSLAKSQCITRYAEEKGLTFIDFNLIGDEVGFDWETDTIDHGDHLNVDGARKITGYLQKYLTDNFSFEDHRNDPSYSKWKEDCQKYYNMLEKKEERHNKNESDNAK